MLTPKAILKEMLPALNEVVRFCRTGLRTLTESPLFSPLATLPTVTTVGTVTTVTGVSSVTACGTVTNVTSLNGLNGVDPKQMLTDVARTAYATGIRSNLTWS
jgi:hypothetical protein